jgi:hypothetical protein
MEFLQRIIREYLRIFCRFESQKEWFLDTESCRPQTTPLNFFKRQNQSYEKLHSYSTYINFKFLLLGVIFLLWKSLFISCNCDWKELKLFNTRTYPQIKLNWWKAEKKKSLLTSKQVCRLNHVDGPIGNQQNKAIMMSQ